MLPFFKQLDLSGKTDPPFQIYPHIAYPTLGESCALKIISGAAMGITFFSLRLYGVYNRYLLGGVLGIGMGVFMVQPKSTRLCPLL